MYVLIKWDGNRLLTVFGPFKTTEQAWANAHQDNGDVTYLFGLRFSVHSTHSAQEVV
jgi:hypothetical protein